MRSIRMNIRIGGSAPIASAIRATDLGSLLPLTQAIVDSFPVITTFASSEFAELSEEGRLWVAAIIREAMAYAAEAGL